MSETEPAQKTRSNASDANSQPPSRSRLPGRRVGEVISSGLWPELPQRATADILGIDIALEEVRIMTSRDFPNPDGSPGKYVVIRCTDESGEEFTTMTGGSVVVDKLIQLDKINAFPITGKITEVLPKRGGRPYLDLT